MALDELSGIINERAARRTDAHVLLQLTLIARETSAPENSPEFEFHLRDDAKEFDPFRLPAGPLTSMPERAEDVDFRALGMHFVQSRVRHFFFRSYQGFNTTMMVI